MSDFLRSLTARSLGTAGQTEVVQPRLPSLYEPLSATYELLDALPGSEADAGFTEIDERVERSAPPARRPAPPMPAAQATDAVPPPRRETRAERAAPLVPREENDAVPPPRREARAERAAPPLFGRGEAEFPTLKRSEALPDAPELTPPPARGTPPEIGRESPPTPPRLTTAYEVQIVRQVFEPRESLAATPAPARDTPAPQPEPRPTSSSNAVIAPSVTVQPAPAPTATPPEPPAPAEPEPVIRVTIGRVEVRAVQPPTPPPPPAPPPRAQPRVTLDEYLRSRR